LRRRGAVVGAGDRVAADTDPAMKASKTEQTRFAPLVAPGFLSFAAACSFAALLTAAGEAHAEDDKALSVDVSLTDRSDVGSANPGTGFDLTAAWRAHGDLITYASELTVGVHDFGGALHPEVYRLMFGSRFGIDWFLRPSVFTRFGVAELVIDDPLRVSWATTAPEGGQVGPVLDDVLGRPRMRTTDLTWQLGLALDVDLMAGVEVGIQGSYNWVRVTDSFDWWQAGAHLTFVIGS
jgi:hypothetical protein